MQAADYRFVDVSGITIADKILPKTDGPDGGALPDRAEDFAFLYEAVNERGTALSPSTGDLVRCNIANALILGVRGETYEPEPGVVASSYWCDINALGALVDEEITGRAFDPLVLWPGIFPGRTIPLGYRGHTPNVVDDVRKMYRDLKRHEGYLRVDDGIDAAGTLSYSENGNVYWTEPVHVLEGAEYGTYNDAGNAYKNVWEYASLSVRAETGDVPPLGLDAAVLVLHVVTEGRQDSDSQLVRRSFAKVIDRPTAQKVNAALPEVYAAAGFSEAWRSAFAEIAEYVLICPFEGRTKLRNLAWNWEPS